MNCTRTITILLFLTAASVASAMRGMQDELLQFGPVGLNAESRKSVQFRTLPNGVRYELQDKPSREFRVENENDLITQFGRVEITVSFRPRHAREYRDTLVFLPKGNPTADTLTVYTHGIGVSQTVERDIAFDTVLTADRGVRFMWVRPQAVERSTFKVIDAPKPPFYSKLDTVRVSGDTAYLGTLVFDSPQAGAFEDRIMIARIDTADDEPLDTLIMHLVAHAVQMECVRDVTCTPTVVMQTNVSTTERRYDMKLPFRFDVVMNEPGTPFSAEVAQRDPGDDVVKVNVTFAPTTVGRFSTTATLRRWRKEPGGGETLVDACTFSISGESKPRPVRLTAQLSPDARTVNVGDTVDLAVRVRTADPIDAPLQLSGVTCSFAYDPSVLVPLLSGNDTRIVENDTAIMTLRTPYANTVTADGDTIALVRVVAVLGSADRSVVAPTSVQAVLNTQQRTLECTSSTITLGNLWTHNGGVRLVNSLKGPLTIAASPNPVADATVITVGNVRENTGTLRVYDATGSVVADFTEELRAGTRSFTWTTSGVLPGVYFVRCANGDANGQTLHMAVRTVVVQ